LLTKFKIEIKNITRKEIIGYRINVNHIIPNFKVITKNKKPNAVIIMPKVKILTI